MSMFSDVVPWYMQEKKRQRFLLHSQMTPPSSMSQKLKGFLSFWVKIPNPETNIHKAMYSSHCVACFPFYIIWLFPSLYCLVFEL